MIIRVDDIIKNLGCVIHRHTLNFWFFGRFFVWSSKGFQWLYDALLWIMFVGIRLLQHDAAWWFMRGLCGPSTCRHSAPAQECTPAARGLKRHKRCCAQTMTHKKSCHRVWDCMEILQESAIICGQVVEDMWLRSKRSLESIGSDDLSILSSSQGPGFQPSPSHLDKDLNDSWHSWHNLPYTCTNLRAFYDFCQRGLLSAAAWRGEARIKSQSQH